MLNCSPMPWRGIVVNCDSARTATHNFLASLMATLEAASEHTGHGRFSAPPKAAIRAFGRIYAGWPLSQDFYRANQCYHGKGAADARRDRPLFPRGRQRGRVAAPA